MDRTAVRVGRSDRPSSELRRPHPPRRRQAQTGDRSTGGSPRQRSRSAWQGGGRRFESVRELYKSAPEIGAFSFSSTCRTSNMRWVSSRYGTLTLARRCSAEHCLGLSNPMPRETRREPSQASPSTTSRPERLPLPGVSRNEREAAVRGGRRPLRARARQVTSGQLTTSDVLRSVNSPAAFACWTAANEVSRRLCAPGFQVAFTIAHSGG
jgi:hypothetical protein